MYSLLHAIEAKVWDFDNLSETFQKVGKVNFKQPGPRPPEFPDLSNNNFSVRLGGAGSRIVIKDPGENSYYDFSNRDEISITAWIKLEKFSNHPAYIIGKGRTHNPGFIKDNQNWALRIVGENNLGKLSFLFPQAQINGTAGHRKKDSIHMPDGISLVSVTISVSQKASEHGLIPYQLLECGI